MGSNSSVPNHSNNSNRQKTPWSSDRSSVKQAETPISRDDFTIQKVLGRGASSVVYQVHNSSGATFALKCLDKRMFFDASLVARQALAERSIMLTLEHLGKPKDCPFLLPSYAFFQDTSNLFILMPAMQCELGKLGRMSEAHAAFACAEILLGLKHMNERDIVFRDLKTANVVVNEHGHCKIADFGLALDLNEVAASKTPVKVAGTLGYIAPEAYFGHAPSYSLDVFAFGIVLYKLLTGHRPFRTPQEVMGKPLGFPANSEISACGQDLISSLLEKDPSQRIGCGPQGWAEVQNHPFFADIDWANIHNQRSPFEDRVGKPQISSVPWCRELSNDPNSDVVETYPALKDWDLNTCKTAENAFIWNHRATSVA